MQLESTGSLSASLQLNNAPVASASQPALSAPELGLQQVLQRLEQQRIVRAGRRIQADIYDLQRSFANLRPAGSGAQGAGSASVLGANFTLSTEASTASFVAAEAINTQTTDFSPANPVWSGLSSADPAIDGFYDGAQGTDTLTFTVTQAGVHGSSNITIEVRDGAADLVDTLSITAFEPVDTVRSLSNGLTVEFGSGVFVLGDSFSVNVEDTVNRQPDADAAFDGSSGEVNFENGVSVSAGTFTVNGETINVLADDSINSVLAKISASAAGVSASYDAASELITLSQTNPGSAFSIVLDNDTSGFLSATKLAGGTLTAGTDAEIDQPIGETGLFSGVVAGNLLINGTAIAIDPAVDTLAAIIDRIAAGVPEVSIELLQNSRVTLTSAGAIELDSNGTNFFVAIGISDDTYEVSQAQAGGSLSNMRINEIVRATNKLLDKFGQLFSPVALAPLLTPLQTLQSDIEQILSSQLQEGFAAFGVDSGFKFSSLGNRYAELNDFAVKRAFKRHLNESMALYQGASRSQPGFLQQLTDAIDTAIDALKAPGLLVDTYV